jgi:hypothetical protein
MRKKFGGSAAPSSLFATALVDGDLYGARNP